MIIWSNTTPEQRRPILQRPIKTTAQTIKMRVREILEDVQKHGDKAIQRWNSVLDNFDTPVFRMDKSRRQSVAGTLSQKAQRAIDTAYDAIYKFHVAQKPQNITVETRPGVICEWHYQPIERVGLYIPGGSASLPSTVLMLAIPAHIAGCRSKVLITPPKNTREPLDPAIAYAAEICGVDEIYLIGGVQAIAALAVGTETVPRVDKIFGPGNAYVTEAKRQVMSQGLVAIDMLAGPSELMIIADEAATPAVVAADLLSQAEHGPDSQVVLISDSASLIEQTQKSLVEQLQKLPRRSIAQKSLHHMLAIYVDSITEAVDICNHYAPEHLIINTEQPRRLLRHIQNAGSIFLGRWTPETAGDYASGTNHCLPTYGTCRTQSALGVADFGKWFAVQEITPNALTELSETLIELARIEALYGHAAAVSVRTQEGGK